MKKSNLEPKLGQIVELGGLHRWEVYRRLQELEIACWCGSGQPLQVQIDNAVEATQLGSVLKQFTAPKHELVGLLENCWLAS